MNESSVAEEWRDVVGHEGKYQVSDQGRVRSLDRVVRTSHGVDRNLKGRALKPKTDKHGRKRVSLGYQGPTRLVHQLVMEAFVGARPEGLVTAHWDGDAANNRLSNLRYTTVTDNHADKRRHGTAGFGETNHQAKLSEPEVKEIRRRYDAGESCTAIHKAMSLACSTKHVWKIALRQRWQHVNG